MDQMGLLLGLAVMATGVAAMAITLNRSRTVAVDLAEYIDDPRPGQPLDEYQQKLAEPLHRRAVRATLERGIGWLGHLMPANYLATIDRKLLLAGEASGSREFVARQVGLTVLLGLMGAAYVSTSDPAPRMALFSLVVMPGVGIALPMARLNRRVEDRKQAITRDLPDTLDLLAISVEAGMGFEGALDVVCRYFQSPLADELSLTLREMELGLPRRDAFLSLRRRTAVPPLSNFIQALLQADALGIPIGRVLKTQATELRVQRRMWAREKAGKLPVKILMPLVLFIFPPIMAVVMGPAAGGISSGLK